jgi:dienelactone hydrolase
MNLLIPMLLAASLMVAPAAFAQGLPAASSATIPLKGAGFFGATANMEAEVFKPAGAGPFPVMVYAHGRSGTPQERLALREVIPRQYLEFWVARGFAAVGVARPGYGRTSGIDREIPGHTWESSGRCGGSFNPDRVAEAAGTAILATIDWVRQQAWAKAGALVVTGNSVGGMTAVLVGSRAPEGVLAVINFAGGVGGNSRKVNRLVWKTRGQQSPTQPLALRTQRPVLGAGDAQNLVRRFHRRRRPSFRIDGDQPPPRARRARFNLRWQAAMGASCRRLPEKPRALGKVCKTPSSRSGVAIQKPLIDRRFLDCHACVIARSKATWQSQ